MSNRACEDVIRWSLAIRRRWGCETAAVDLDDVPRILGGVAEFAARDTGRETVVANGDLLVNKLIRKVIRSLGHGSNEDADALLIVEVFDVFSDADQLRVETESDLAAVGWKVIGDGVLDDLEEFLLGVDGSDGESVK